MRFLSYLSMLLIAVLITACGGGGGSPGANSVTAPTTPTPLFTTAPASLTLGVGASQEFTVSGGTAPYTAVSNNTGVAVGAVSGSSLTLGGVSLGAAEVTVRDATGTAVTVSLTVNTKPFITTAPIKATIAIGASPVYTVSGGLAPFSATSSNTAVATASVSGGNLIITGVALGTADVVLRDATGRGLVIEVTVPSASTLPLFTSAPSSVTLSVGVPVGYTIGGGTGPYTATSSNSSVVTAGLVGTTLTLTGKANGSASVLIRDASGAPPISIAATVNAGQMSLIPDEASAYIGSTIYSAITGGTLPYNTISSFPDGVEVTIGTLSGNVFTANANGTIMRILVKQAALSNIIVVRDANGNSTNFTLTASAGTNQISLSPSALTISEQGTFTITLTLYGASGTVNLFSSDTTLITVASPVTGTSTGTPVTVTKQAACVTADANVTITAIDATGAQAISVITIKDNPSPPCP